MGSIVQRVRRRLDVFSPSRYFSPKWFGVFVVALTVGAFIGGLVYPMGGQLLGIFVVGFLCGRSVRTRQYVEMFAAGSLLGFVTVGLDIAIVSFINAGHTTSIVGMTSGLLTSLGSYYLGRKT